MDNEFKGRGRKQPCPVLLSRHSLGWAKENHARLGQTVSRMTFKLETLRTGGGANHCSQTFGCY